MEYERVKSNGDRTGVEVQRLIVRSGIGCGAGR
jgi:hypothetical protein